MADNGENQDYGENGGQDMNNGGHDDQHFDDNGGQDENSNGGGGGGGHDSEASPEPEHMRKLFIGGLDYKTTEQSLRDFFGKWGDLLDAVVMTCPYSKRSRGFGFVTYINSSCVDTAMNNRPHVIDGRTVESKRAIPREQSAGETNMSVKKMFVGGLSSETDEDDLKDYFSKYGHVEEAVIVTEKETGRKRGFGFITFDDYDAVDKVVLQRHHMIKGKRTEVKKALSKMEMDKAKRKNNFMGPPGGPMGGGGGMRGGPNRGGFPPRGGFGNEWQPNGGGYGASQPWQQPPPAQGQQSAYPSYNSENPYQSGGAWGGYNQQGGGGGYNTTAYNSSQPAGGYNTYNQQPGGAAGGPIRGGGYQSTNVRSTPYGRFSGY